MGLLAVRVCNVSTRLEISRYIYEEAADYFLSRRQYLFLFLVEQAVPRALPIETTLLGTQNHSGIESLLVEQPQLLILVVLVPTVQVGDPSLLAAVVEPPLPSPNMDLLRPSLARVLSTIEVKSMPSFEIHTK